jgi:hypothetical protein
MQDLSSVQREEVLEQIHEITIVEEAINDDICYVRDPNVAAMLCCLGKIIVRIKLLKSVRFGLNKPPAQKIVMFGFKGHDEVYAYAVKAKLNSRSSTDFQNINIGEYLMVSNVLKTIIHSFI